MSNNHGLEWAQQFEVSFFFSFPPPAFPFFLLLFFSSLFIYFLFLPFFHPFFLFLFPFFPSFPPRPPFFFLSFLFLFPSSTRSFNMMEALIFKTLRPPSGPHSSLVFQVVCNLYSVSSSLEGKNGALHCVPCFNCGTLFS